MDARNRITPAFPSLSPYARASLAPSPANRMMEAFASVFRDGLDINLGVGYVHEGTIPRQAALAALERIVDRPHQHREAFNYGGSRGSPNLLASLRRFLSGRRGLSAAFVDSCELLVGANGATSLLDGLSQLFEPGIVVTPEPFYYIYVESLLRRGFEILAVPEDGEGIRTNLLRERLAALGPRRRDVRFLYVPTVGNPTCTMLSGPRREELLAIAQELSQGAGTPVPLVLDRAYEDLVHDDSLAVPGSLLPRDRSALCWEIGTLSKILAPALRIGYLLARPSPLVPALLQRTSDAGFSASVLNQEIASVLLDEHVGPQIERVLAAYRDKAALALRAAREELGHHLVEVRGGQAGFYLYLELAVETSEDSAFFRFLARATGDPAIDGPAEAPSPRVVYIPGEHFVLPHGAQGRSGRRQLRLSYAFETPERIRRALALMRAAAEHASDTADAAQR